MVPMLMMLVVMIRDDEEVEDEEDAEDVKDVKDVEDGIVQRSSEQRAVQLKRVPSTSTNSHTVTGSDPIFHPAAKINLCRG